MLTYNWLDIFSFYLCHSRLLSFSSVLSPTTPIDMCHLGKMDSEESLY